MELDDLRNRWTENDRRLDAMLRVTAHGLRASLRAEGALQRHSRGVAFELLGNILALLLTGSFLASHIREPRYFIAGLVLHLFAIALAGACVRQLVQLREIDYAGPVVAMQRTIEQARIEWIRTTKWTLLAAPLLWTPLLIVTMRGLLGLDAYALLDTRWLIANVLFGAAFLPLMLWASRRFAARMQPSTLQRAMDALSGRGLAEARQFADDVARFENENP